MMPQEPSNQRMYTSPSRLLVIVAASVFVSEALVMVLLMFLPPLPHAAAAPLDATLVTILMYPILYRFMLRPMTQHISEREQAEAALNRANDKLESRVRERTEELAQANESLQAALEVSQQRQTEIVGLLKGARAVLEYRDFKEVAQAILKVCKDVIGAPVGYVALPSEDRASENIVFSECENSAQVRGRELQMPIRGLTSQVYSTGKAVCVNDYANSEGAEMLPEGHVKLHNIIFAPMVIKGFVVGLVCLANKSGGFAEDDMRLTTAFAELAAIALLNSQTLELLESSETRFRTLAQATFEGIAISENGIIREVNEQFAQIHGNGMSDMIGRPITDFLAKEQPEHVKRTVTSDEDHIGEYRVLRKDGSTVLVEVHGRSIERSGRLVRITAMRDISERKRAEEATAWLASFPEFNPNPICEVDLAGRIHYLNPEAQRLLPDLAMLGLRHPWLVDLETASQQFQRSQTKVVTREVTIDEAIYQQTLHFVSSYLRIRIYGHDITERKRMEEALRCAQIELEARIVERTQELAQANEDLRLQMTAVRAAANGIVITDQQGNVRWCNPAFTRMTGYTFEEALGRNMRFLKSNEQSPEFYRRLWETILSGQVWQGEIVNRRKDGSLYVEEETIAPVLNEEGEIINFVSVKQDVTERKQAEAELTQKNRDLLAMSIAEHDLRQLAETLTAANSALTQSLNLEAVLEALLDHVERLVPYDSANVMLLEAESRLSVRVARGYEQWGGAELVYAITLDVQANPILNALLTTRRSSLVSDTRAQPGWETLPGVEHVRSWLGVPLMAGGNVIGLYSLDKTEPGFFTREHIRKAEILAGQAAVAIQNAWLFEQVRAGRERLQSLSRRLVEVQEAERQYVARELHDEAGQALTSLLFGLSQIEQQTDSTRQADQVVELKEMTNGIIESLHRLAMDLRPASLDHLGLVPALLQYVKTIGDRYGLTARFKVVGLESERLPSDVETALYRIVQEALTNIVRHARATRVDVLLERRGDQVVVVVEDNGTGFDAEITRFMQAGHLGLAGMQERAEMLGGSLIIESAAGTGTTLVVEVPYGDSYPGC